MPEDFIVTELLQDGREVMLEDPDGAGEDAVADEEEEYSVRLLHEDGSYEEIEGANGGRYVAVADVPGSLHGAPLVILPRLPR